MSSEPSPDDFCYRHPGRVSYVLCQRCARTVCGDCQIPAAVGVHCPECQREARAQRVTVRRRTWSSDGSSTPVTYGLLGAIVVIYGGQLLSSGLVTEWLLYYPPFTLTEPWRMITSLFVHSERSLFHILFNGYSLWVLGTILERMVGSLRFAGLFALSGLGGSVAVLWLAPGSAVIGASGAIFGLFGALLVIQRSFGVTNPQLLVVVVINLVLGFLVPGVSWQAHIGGLITGLALAWGLVAIRERGQHRGSAAVMGIAFGVIAVLTVARFVLA